MGLFSLTSENHIEQISEQATSKMVAKYVGVHLAKVKKINEISRGVDAGECLCVWTNAAFNTMSLLLWQIEHDGDIQQLYVSTYSFSLICLKTFFAYFDCGKIADVHFLINENNVKLNAKKYYFLIGGAKKRGIPVRMSNNHSKVVLAKSNTWNMVYCGSGNFSENSTVEHYNIFNDLEIFNFFKSNIDNEGIEAY